MVASVIFGCMDRPILEKRLFIFITISSIVLLLISFIIDFQALLMHSIFILLGVSAGRKMILIVGMSLRKNKSRINLVLVYSKNYTPLKPVHMGAATRKQKGKVHWINEA